MKTINACYLLLSVGVLLLTVGPARAQTLDPLPEGNSGIAARYPGDKGIDKDPAVLFADDFESCTSIADVKKKWDVVVHEANLSIAEGASHEHGGRKSLLITIPQQHEPLASGVDKLLNNTQEVLFLRWYMKFDGGWLVPGNSVHNGGSISSKYFDNGRATPGVRADGRNKFLVNYENENSTGDSPGLINFYVYWPEQFDIWGDHFYPLGTVIPGSYTRRAQRHSASGSSPGPISRPSSVAGTVMNSWSKRTLRASATAGSPCGSTANSLATSPT